MNKDRWQQIDRLFDQVLEISAEERKAFIDKNCSEDEDLKIELLSLLEAHAKTENFIEDSAIKVVTKQLEKDRDFQENASFVGKKFGSYSIEKLIGEGGMGEVYLANDEKLKRKVALKILPIEYTNDLDKVRRLTREARAISALNHPNIVTIHDVGKFETVNYITTEYVDGKTLRDLMDENLDIEKILDLIIQCCDALSIAHKEGIIHRDIKPENIMVREDGYVKILDFGLAKLTNQADSIKLVETLKGTIMGTPTYMSPEQIDGTKVDNRTDLWSIAVVLYEMLTKANPFKKPTRRETFQSILSDNPPPPSKYNSKISPELDAILIKALEKNPDLSYQTASDLMADLRRVKREFSTSSLHVSSNNSFPPVSNRPSYSNILGITSFFIITVLIGGLIWYFFFNNNATSITPNWTKAQNIRLTNQNGTEFYPSLAPDGESFVYAAKSSDNFDIFLRRIDGKNPINLTEPFKENDSQPAFSPDGKQIAFRSDRDGGGVFIMQETGENPRRVSDFGHHPSWSPDGKLLAISEKGNARPTVRTKSAIWIINVENGEKRKLTGTYSYQPNWSPNGKRIAFWSIGNKVSKRDIASVSVDGGKPELVTNSASTNWNPVWSTDGKYLYFASNRSGYMAIWRVQIDENTGKTLGDAEVIPTPAKFNRHFSFSKDGKRLIYVQLNIQSNLKGVNFDPNKGVPTSEAFWITNGEQEILRPRLSPDGKQFVINLARQTQDDIVLIDRNGKNWRDLTNDKYFDRYPIWAENGKQIAFYSDRGGNNQIWMMNSDGSNLRLVTPKGNQIGFPVTSPDGKKITYRASVDETHYIKNISNLDSPSIKVFPRIKNFSFATWDWSSNGKKLAGRWRDSDNNIGIGYYSLETNKYMKIWEGLSTMPRWLPDNKRVIFSYTGKIHILNTETKDFSEISSIPDNDVIGVGISRDGRLLYYIARKADSNIWLLDLNE